MNKIIKNYTNKILNIWEKIVETPILYICLTYSYMFENNLELYAYRVFKAIVIMPCTVRSLSIEK